MVYIDGINLKHISYRVDQRVYTESLISTFFESYCQAVDYVVNFDLDYQRDQTA
jgi:hypothetical protein